MKRHPYLLLLFLAMLLVSCGQVTPTPAGVGPVDIAGTMVQYQVAAGATSNAVSIQMSATAQVIGATSTQYAYATQAAVTEQARVYAQATSDQARQDAQATQARIDFEATQAQARRDAEATSQQARLDVESTTTASGMQTAFAITQTAIPPANTMTAIANNQAIALANNEVEKSNLDVEQQRQKNSVEWVTPYLIALVATVVGAIFVIRYSRVRELKNDDGDVEGFLVDGDKFIRPRLLGEPVIILDGEEVKAAPISDHAEQAEVTRRSQAVDALKNMPVNPTSQAGQTFNKFFDQQRPRPKIEVLQDGQLPRVILDDIEDQVVQED